MSAGARYVERRANVRARLALYFGAMPTEIVVRPAVAADEPFVLGLTSRFGEGDLPRGLTADEVGAGTRRWIAGVLARRAETDHVVVAESAEGEPLGFL